MRLCILIFAPLLVLRSSSLENRDRGFSLDWRSIRLIVLAWMMAPLEARCQALFEHHDLRTGSSAEGRRIASRFGW